MARYITVPGILCFHRNVFVVSGINSTDGAAFINKILEQSRCSGKKVKVNNLVCPKYRDEELVYFYFIIWKL